MLQVGADFLVYTVLGLDPHSRTGAALNFFIYDSVKIMLLLFGMIALIGVIRTYLPQEKIRRGLSNKKRSYAYAALFGAATPFCSCSSIPIFIGFIRAGIPLGVTLTFLITSPLINEYLVVLMIGMMGVKITAAYVASGMAIGIISGAILGSMRLEKYLVSDLSQESPEQEAGFRDRFKARLVFGLNEAVTIVRKLWFWVLIGVGVGSLIHNFVPQESIHNVISRTGAFSVPLATLLGVPLYGSCAAIVPIAAALFQKGVPLGTALSFMMAIAALSLPEAIMLRRVMKLPLILIFFSVTTLAIILTGYLFNFLF